MPYSLNNLPDAVKNKSEKAKKAFLSAYDSAIQKGHSDEEALFAGLAAMKNVEKVTKSLDEIRPKLLLKNKQLLEKAVEQELAKTVDQKEITKIEFDSYNRLVVTFSNKDKLISNALDIATVINKDIAISINPVFDYVRFNITADQPNYEEGVLFYDKDDKALCYYNDDSGVKVTLGREQLVRVYNHTGSTLLNGQVVYIVDAEQGWPEVTLAKADTDSNSQGTLGLVTADILNQDYGYVCTNGIVHLIDTTAFTSGDKIYLSATTAGSFTNVEPLQPNYIVELGIIINSDPLGKIYVHVDKKSWHPFLEVSDYRATVVLPNTPTVFKPNTVDVSYGVTYDPLTGIITYLKNSSYTVSMTFNAEPSASNKNIYIYAEGNIGAGWFPLTDTGRRLQLLNAQETQLSLAVSRYIPKGAMFRLLVWGDSTVTLKTSALSPDTPTITLPAFKMQIAG